MAESLSRYSIVERWTERKLEIMKSKSNLKEQLKEKEQKIEEHEKDFQNWEIDVEENIKREKREKQRAIEKAKQEYQNVKERMSEKEKVYDEQIKAIEKALSSIEEISKTSPTNSP